MDAVIEHCARMGDRVAVLDAPPPSAPTSCWRTGRRSVAAGGGIIAR
ncbi:hypothetical protein [Streptomyces sp. NPDC059991]